MGKTGEVLSRLPLARVGFASIALVGLLLGALLLLQTPAETAPKTTSVIAPDTDGDVPVEVKCEPDGNPEWGEEWVGMYQWKNVRDDSNNVKETYGRVYLNLCRMEDLGFTREEKLAVLRHEKAHGHGWIHGEGTRPRPIRPTTATTTSTASRGRSSAVSSSLAPSSAQTEFDRPEG